MKIFKTSEFIKAENPTPGELFRSDILTREDKAREIGGILAILEPGNQVPYHYHENRESIIVVISGEAMENVEGEEFPIRKGDVLFIPSMEKHGMINESDEDVRYIEFWTYPHLTTDFIKVENKHIGG